MPPSTPDGRSRDTGRKPKFGRQLVIFVVMTAAGLVAVAAVTGDRGYLDVKRQRAEYSRIRAEVSSLRDENGSLLAEVRGLRSDPYVIEKIAREKLGYARPGEIIFRLRQAPPK